jgi:GNAT superfamily N-acetyltransferase
MAGPDIQFRRVAIASPAAREMISALDAELLALYPEDDTVHHFRLDTEELAPGRGAFLMALAEELPLACGAVRMLDSGTAEVKRMYVAPSARGRGLGRRMLEALEAEARRLGAGRLVLETGPRQPEALALYESAGFSTIPAFGVYQESPLSVFLGKDL